MTVLNKNEHSWTQLYVNSILQYNTYINPTKVVSWITTSFLAISVLPISFYLKLAAAVYYKEKSMDFEIGHTWDPFLALLFYNFETWASYSTVL